MRRSKLILATCPSKLSLDCWVSVLLLTPAKSNDGIVKVANNAAKMIIRIMMAIIMNHTIHRAHTGRQHAQHRYRTQRFRSVRGGLLRFAEGDTSSSMSRVNSTSNEES